MPAPSEIHWYHTFDLPSGTTQGLFDLRPVAPQLPIPADLTGKRCLDAAASDGWWGFELARRGAAEVVSLDLGDSAQKDYQHRARAIEGLQFWDRATAAFNAVKDELDVDTISRVDMSVYDATPEAIGTFDYAFMGNIMLHLSDPARAAGAMRRVLNDDGEFLSLEPVSLAMTALSRKRPVASLFVADTREPHRNDFSRWWLPNPAGHRALVEAGGFVTAESGALIFQPVGDWRPRWPDKLPRNVRELHYWAVVRQRGIPSSWVRARPE
jgi:tRNA (mo5U34)-methyltransferase